MPLTLVNVGAAANDNTGDSLRNAFIKVNNNCTYLDEKAPNAHTHPLSQLTQSGAAAGQVATWSGTAWVPTTPSTGNVGTVTSVGLTLPNIFNVANSPVTGAGTIAATFTTQTAGTVLAAPATNNAAPSFRALVATDIPALNYEAAGAVAAHAALTDTAHGMSVYGADFVTSATASAARTKLALGTSATLNAPATGDATTSQVVLGTDTRLTNARTPTAHVHAASDVTSGIFDIGRIPTGSTASTVCIGNDSRLSDARTPLSHTHGNITNVGAIGSTANLPLITTTSGVITTGAFGSTANTFCQGNDSRLSDARTPLAHTHALSDLTQSGATSGQVVSWNGSAWAPANVAASQNTFSTFAVSGQSSVVADSTADTLTLVAGTNVTITTDATTDTITISASGGSGGGNISGPNSGITDNALVRWDQVNTQIQNSGVILSDTQEMTGLRSLTFSTAVGGTTGLAKMVWDTTNQTIDLGIGAGSVNALLGVDSHVLGRNTTGNAISRGQVVRVNGASSGNLTIALAQGNTDPNTANTIGIAAEDIANNETGMVITNGLLRNLNTASFTAGDLLYISPTTAGLLVNTIPTAPNHAVRMGYVVSSSPTNGIIYVAVNNGYELSELHDVNYPTTPATNDFLVYTSNRWENQTAATARTSMGLGALATVTPASGVATFLTTPSSANLASAVTDETGSGSLVFGTSPTISNATLTGQAIHDAGTVSAPSISFSGSATTGMYLSAANQVSIATSGIEALRFPSSGRVQLGASGTNTVPSLAHVTFTNTGLFFPASSTLGFTTGGSEAMRIDSAQRLIVGGSQQAQILDGAGTALNCKITSGATTGAAGLGVVVQDGTNNRRIGLFVDQTNAVMGISSGYSSIAIPFIYRDATAERLRIDTSGRLLVGGTSGASLTDGAGVSFNPSIISTGSSGTTGVMASVFDGTTHRRVGLFCDFANTIFGISTSGGGPFVIRDATAERLRITTNGEVQIAAAGTAAAPALSVGYTNTGLYSNAVNEISITTNGNQALRITNAQRVLVTQNGTAVAPSLARSGDQNTGLWFPAASVLAFSTNSTERLRLDSTGNVIVNTAAVATTATDGFLYVSSCAGAPTGTPTAYTGRVPIVVDTTNNLFQFYSSGAWRTALSSVSLTSNVTGILPVANGGTGQATVTAAFNVLAPGTTKGDLIVHDGTNEVRLAVGATNGHVLTVDSTTATGVKWAAASGGGGGSGPTNVWIPAAQWIPRTTSGCGINSLEASTNKVNYDVLEFDAATAEYAQVAIVMPSNWNAGTITAKFHWTAASGTGNVIFGLSGRAYADNSALDQAMGTAQTATDALQTANAEHISAATSAITLAGSPAAGQMVIFELYRDAANASDTLGVDARFLGVEITYTAA